MTKFKLKSGNTSPFKEMGSSPVKQKELLYTKRTNYVKYNAKGNRIDMMGNEHTAKARANRNMIGAPKKKGNVGYKAKSTLPKDFNIKGDPSKTPGRAQTKMAKQVLKQGTKKGISRLAGPIGAGLLAYDVLKTGVKRVAKGIKTGKPQTKLKGKNIKDTFKRVKKKKYI